jgi:hypothetical protein
MQIRQSSMKKIALLLILLLPFFAYSQKWRKNRKELIIGGGPIGYMGDLGGANEYGSKYLKDYNLGNTRLAAMVGLRYRIDTRQYVKGAFYAGLVKGSDKSTKEIHRNNRNLTFRSPIIELSAQYEFVVWKAKEGKHYSMKRVKTIKQAITLLHPNTYLFVGAGGFFFNPQGPAPGNNNQWVSLQPLGTEGQGIISGSTKYSRVSLAIPYGIGLVFNLGRLNSLGIEFGIRKTFTDYIDDVSGVYYDKEQIRAKYGDLAASMSDPSISNPERVGWTNPGEKRGNVKNKDSYGFLLISFSQKIATKKTRAKF